MLSLSKVNFRLAKAMHDLRDEDRARKFVALHVKWREMARAEQAAKVSPIRPVTP